MQRKALLWWTKGCCWRWRCSVSWGQAGTGRDRHTVSYCRRVTHHSPLSIAPSPQRTRSGCRLAPLPRSSRLRTRDAVLTALPAPTLDQQLQTGPGISGGLDGEPYKHLKDTRLFKSLKQMTKQSIKYWLYGIMHKLDVNYCQKNCRMCTSFFRPGWSWCGKSEAQS